MARMVGIGLVALDVVLDDASGERLAAAAGGSCGNVMAILSWLGWTAAPVARLGDGRNARLVREDLKRWGVDDRWLSLPPPGKTPVYIERLRHGPDGEVSHRFERLCPHCKRPLPRYQAVLRASLDAVIDDLGSWDAVYVDRPSAGAVRLAEAARAADKLVVFEPSARGSEQQLAALARVAHIVKYSADRLNDAERRTIADARPWAEIETLGAAGLSYRTSTGCELLSPPRVVARDTAGAGDWTTAGLLYRLAQLAEPETRPSVDALREALRFAQALGAWSCRFIGPRGAMEADSRDAALAAAQALLAGERHTARRRRQPPSHTSAPAWACRGCS